MSNPLAAFSDRAYALLRIVSGLLLSLHGAEKLFGLFGSAAETFGSQMWYGGCIELICGLLIALGFFATPAAFLASGTMAVAYFQFHWPITDPKFDASFFPGVNKGELAVVYCFLFLYVACRGNGPWSLGNRGRG